MVGRGRTGVVSCATARGAVRRAAATRTGRFGGERWWCDVHGREHIDVHGVASTRRRGFAKSPADSMAAY